MSLLRSLFWLSIFLGATFFFAVIFQHGFSNFPENAQKQFGELQGYITAAMGKAPAAKSDKG